MTSPLDIGLHSLGKGSYPTDLKGFKAVSKDSPCILWLGRNNLQTLTQNQKPFNLESHWYASDMSLKFAEKLRSEGKRGILNATGKTKIARKKE